MNSLNEAFEDLIKDSHNAEKQIIKALPNMIAKCSSDELKKSLESHLKETNEHVKKLEKIAQICGFQPTGKMCPAMKGLVEEADEHLKEGKPGPVLDAVIIAVAQKVEHYEISGYGTARTWAESLGMKEVMALLDEILQQEGAADRKLNDLAISHINQDAMGKANGKTAGAKSKVSVR